MNKYYARFGTHSYHSLTHGFKLSVLMLSLHSQAWEMKRIS